MDELAPGTIRVKHKLISFLPFVIINELDFDPEMHSLYQEPASGAVEELVTPTTESESSVPELEPEAEIPPKSEPPTGKKGTKA
jgi:hypothetical protein